MVPSRVPPVATGAVSRRRPAFRWRHGLVIVALVACRDDPLDPEWRLDDAAQLLAADVAVATPPLALRSAGDILLPEADLSRTYLAIREDGLLAVVDRRRCTLWLVPLSWRTTSNELR